MVSAVVSNLLGIAGGIVLTAMLLPQMWQLWKTRRADDLSHTFMGMYNAGLTFLLIYTVWEELWAFVGFGAIQLVLGIMMQAGKVWADSWQRQQRAQGGRLTHALSLRSGARLDFQEFAAGTAAPFPLLRPAPTHAAQHLLLDARVALPGSAQDCAKGGAAVADPATAAAAFGDVSRLLEGALSDAGLLQGKRQLASNGKGKGSEEEGGGAEAAPTAFFMCRDAYAVATWHAPTASLSVDCLAVSGSSMHDMTAAAEAFCAALKRDFPGSRIAASSLGRLPS